MNTKEAAKMAILLMMGKVPGTSRAQSRGVNRDSGERRFSRHAYANKFKVRATPAQVPDVTTQARSA
jgi:hypothetical protein